MVYGDVLPARVGEDLDRLGLAGHFSSVDGIVEEGNEVHRVVAAGKIARMVLETELDILSEFEVRALAAELPDHTAVRSVDLEDGRGMSTG